MSTMLCNTNDLYLALIDLTSPAKEAQLRRTDCGPRAWDALIEMRDRLGRVVQSGKPYAAELAAADKRHDIACAVLELTCRTHELPAALPEFAHLAARAEQVRATLNFGLGLTATSYVDTAATAARNRNALPRCIQALRQMPVVEDIDAAELVQIFVGGGEEVGLWLGRRADAEAEQSAARAEVDGRSLINEARELLSRLRASVEAEISWRDDLPHSLTGALFAVLDARINAAIAAARGNRASGLGEDAVAELDAEAEREAQAAAAEDGGRLDDVQVDDLRVEGAPLDPVAPAADGPAGPVDGSGADPRPSEGAGGSSTNG